MNNITFIDSVSECVINSFRNPLPGCLPGSLLVSHIPPHAEDLVEEQCLSELLL